MEKLKALYNGPDNTNINVFRFGNEAVALSDFWLTYTFDINTLRNVTRNNPVLPSLPSVANLLPIISSAHPLREYGKDSAITIVSVNSPLPFYSSTTNVVRILSLNQRELIASIPVPQVSFMHSFALTQHYAILFADPLFINFPKVLQHATLVKSVYWQPKVGTAVYVVNLKTGHVTKLHVDALLHLHHVNSYEQDNHIYIDFVTYPSFSFLTNYTLDLIRNPKTRQYLAVNANLVRYEIDLLLGTIIRQKPTNPQLPEVISNKLDFPAINEHFRFRSYCFVYGLIANADGQDYASMWLVKKDLCRGDRDR